MIQQQIESKPIWVLKCWLHRWIYCSVYAGVVLAHWHNNYFQHATYQTSLTETQKLQNTVNTRTIVIYL